MSVIRNVNQTRELYLEAGEKGWVLPCFCSENLTTTEAVLSAAEDFRRQKGYKSLPVILAITCLYDHRSQAVNYTQTKRWDTGLKLFTNEIKTLCENGGPFKKLDVMIHLDHIQHDVDYALLESDLHDYASILYDASALPFEENIRKTADFVNRRGKDILVEGACDEIVDATGGNHNDLTTPQQALRYWKETGADLIVCNLGTEHRATGKDLQYHGEVSREIKNKIGTRIVLHGTSSVSNDQVKSLYGDGVCKVNIWTSLERDSSPLLFEEMVRNARKVADKETVDRLVAEGSLTEKANPEQKMDIGYFTTLYRQGIIFDRIKAMTKAYFDLWYV